MKRKLVIALLATVMAGSLLMSGCSGSDESSKVTTATTEETGTQGTEDKDQKTADEVAALIDAIYVQERTDDTDAQCKAAKKTRINQNRSASWQSGFAYLLSAGRRSGAGMLCSPKNFSIHTMSYQRSNLYPHW